MTDKDILEFAAKAAGYVVDSDGDRIDVRDSGGGPLRWNPLEDDGDALRMAVKLKISIIQADDGRAYAQWVDGCDCLQEEQADGGLPAVRRAITRAAAEIGRAMP